MQKQITDHFNEIAKGYDHFKLRYNYYYDSVKKIVKETVPPNLFTLEIGCGTGEMLDTVTRRGVGIDPSTEMIKIAKKKYPHLNFLVMSAENITFNQKFDVVLVVGVVEHLSNFGKTIKNIKRVTKEKGSVLITTVHPLYRPVITWAGKFGLKMDEGKHRWLSVCEIIQALEENNFKVIKKFNDLALPLRIPLLSHWINNSFLNNWFGLTQYVYAIRSK